MDKFTSRFEDIWKNNGIIAWSLVVCGMGLAIWATYCPQSPGVSIGMLALVAGIMSVRPEMHIYEKMAWIAILIAFAVLEVRAINRTDNENKATRTEQNEKFEAIAENLKDSIKISKGQFNTTIQHVDGVMTTAQALANLAKNNLENTTGGDSFAYITPQNVEGPGPYFMNIRNEGNYSLSGVVVRTVRVRSECIHPEASTPCIQMTDAGGTEPVQLGTLPPQENTMMPTKLDPQIRADGMAHYTIYVTAQNGDAVEELWFRQSKNAKGLAYSLAVIRLVRGNRKVGDFPVGKYWARTLKTIDWTEPAELPQ